MLIQHYTREKKPSRENSRHSAREIKISTRENYSNSARENSGLPVKIFKIVGVKVKFPPVKKTQKTVKIWVSQALLIYTWKKKRWIAVLVEVAECNGFTDSDSWY